MDLTTVYWILCVTLVVAICVMAASLVSIVASIVEQIQRISGRHARN
jgi:predicted PurR-regulated permease PerM